MRIEIFSRRTWRGKRWFFRIVAGNGEPIAQSEGYHNRSDVFATANSLRAGVFDAAIREVDR